MKIAKIKFSDSGKVFEKGQVVNLPEERLSKIAHLLEDSPSEKIAINPEAEKVEMPTISTEKVKRKKKDGK